MSSMRAHLRTTKGFCLCHLLCVWQVAGKLCFYLGYFNASYVAAKSKFVLDEQLFVQLITVANLILAAVYCWLSQRWYYDQLILLLYVPLYVYFIQLRQHLTRLLNECVVIHQTLQHALGSWLCVSLRKGSVLTLLLPLELLLLLVWQYHKYYSYQFGFIAGIALIYHMQLVFLGNFFIWLGSIYRALNEFLRLHMSSTRIGTLRTIVRLERIMWRLHGKIIHYFALHLLSFVALIVMHVCRLVLSEITHDELYIDRLQFGHVWLLLSLLITLLITAHELQLQRRKFYQSYLYLEDRVEYFQLKSWGLLKSQALRKPFGLPLLRPAKKKQRKWDIITMLFASNLPAPELRQNVLPLLALGLGTHKVHVSLPQMLSFLIQLGCMLLAPLLMHTHLRINFYTCLTPSYFGDNVTTAISQVYRWFNYDEME